MQVAGGFGPQMRVRGGPYLKCDLGLKRANVYGGEKGPFWEVRDLIRRVSVWRQVLLPLNVNYSCRFGRLLVRRRTVRWALLWVLKT